MTKIAEVADNVTTFRTWLLSQAHRDDPIGDVARDVIRDKGTRATTYHTLRERISEIGNTIAVEAIDAANHEYVNLVRPDNVDPYEVTVNYDYDLLDLAASAPVPPKRHPLTERFLAFNRQNPAVYAVVVRSCFEYRKATGNAKWGVNDCLGRVRWVLQVETADASGYKINATHAPFYSRLVMHNEPTLEGFFDLRDAEADLDGTWIAQANHDLGVTR